MGLALGQLSRIVEEIRPVLVGGRIQKVFQPLSESIALEIRRPGRTLLLLLCADPETARLHVITYRPPSPPQPPAFCQFLRAHLHGARIDALDQIPGDRIVRLRLATRDSLFSLIGALTGRTADLILTDGEDRILVTLHSGHQQSGRLYLPPTRKPDSHPEEPALPAPEADPQTPFPLSAALEAQYSAKEMELGRIRLRQARIAHLKRAIKKVKRRVDALQNDLAKANRFREYARYGELLKTNLGQIAKGQDSITLVDYFDPAMPELVLPLDPAKSAQGNLQDYFRKYQKHLAAEREIRPRLKQTELELDSLLTDRTAAEQGTWQPTTAPLTRQSRNRPFEKTEDRSRPAVPRRTGPFRRFVSADGLPIYVGKNARENEELTFGLAKSDDLWLHARGIPGSHVVVRLERGAEPPPETLRDAATLALLYSDLKKSGKGEVIYTKRKYVRKVKGQPPGTVTVTQEKAVFVTLDKTRLEALKQRGH